LNREQWLFNVDHGQPHHDTAEHHGSGSSSLSGTQ
jgi:hypothetical protein